MGSSTPSRTPTLPPSRPWPGASAARAAVGTLEDCQRHDANTCHMEARSLENDYQDGALGMLPEGTGVCVPHVRGTSPSHQQELQDACTILAQNPRSTNLHFRPVEPGGHSPHPLLSLAISADRADNAANLAAGPAVPQVDFAAPSNVANRVHTPFLRPLNVLCIAAGGAAGCGAAVPPPAANNLILLVHPGPVGAANNLAASRQCQQRIANAAVAGVGGVIDIDKVEANSMRHPQNHDNIKAIDGINDAMFQATRMISQAIGWAQPPTTAAAVAPLPNATTRLLPPGGDGDVIASLYARLVSARAANRMDAVVQYERMINRLKRKKEEELKACLSNHN
jgi:hypothetical protein